MSHLQLAPSIDPQPTHLLLDHIEEMLNQHPVNEEQLEFYSSQLDPTIDLFINESAEQIQSMLPPSSLSGIDPTHVEKRDNDQKRTSRDSIGATADNRLKKGYCRMCKYVTRKNAQNQPICKRAARALKRSQSV